MKTFRKQYSRWGFAENSITKKGFNVFAILNKYKITMFADSATVSVAKPLQLSVLSAKSS